jgi:hypothetical protein
MHTSLVLLSLPRALCDVRFTDSSSHSFVILIVFLSSTAIVLGPCMLSFIWIKKEIDKERAALLIDESAIDLPQAASSRRVLQYESKVHDIKELSTFKAWFSLFEKRVAPVNTT